MERIRSRGRGVESGISAEYLEALYQGYEDFLAEISKTIPVVRVDYDRFRSVEEMAVAIEREDWEAIERFDLITPEACRQKDKKWRLPLHWAAEKGAHMGMGRR